MKVIKDYIVQHRRILLIDAILLVIFLAVGREAHKMADAMVSQQEAARWENDAVTNVTKKKDDGPDKNKKKLNIRSLVGEKRMPYAQVSAFISPGRMFDSDGINDVRGSLQSTLVKDARGESQTGGRVWIDAYSCETDISLRKDSNNLSVKAVGIGGDFFQFHPMKLLSGSYISESDINHDRIVVDENFAWTMFGSNDIVGMQVWYGDNIYYIAGVVKVDEDDISEYAYGDQNRVYMMYDELKKKNDSIPITCYEVVYPNPISNYAFYAVRTAYGLSDEESDQLDKKKDNPLSFDDVEIIENTKRYNDMELLLKVKHWNLRTMRTSSIGYPFWENIARVCDERLMILLLLRLVLLVFPVISIIWLIYGLWERRTWTFKALIVGKIDDLVEKRRAEKYYQQENENEEMKKQSEEGMTEDDESPETSYDESPEAAGDGSLEAGGDVLPEPAHDGSIETDGDVLPKTAEDDTEIELVSVLDEDLL